MFTKKKKKEVFSIREITIKRVLNGWSLNIEKDVFHEEDYVYNQFDEVLHKLVTLDL